MSTQVPFMFSQHVHWSTHKTLGGISSFISSEYKGCCTYSIEIQCMAKLHRDCKHSYE